MPASATDREAAVRAAFVEEAEFCAKMEAPFMARLCTLLGERLDRSTAIGRRMLDWPGNPDASHDVLPLRLAGGLHALARSEADPALKRVYPAPADVDDDALWEELSRVLSQHGAFLDPWLDGTPQTNEVGRSAVLMAGLMEVAARFRQPMRLLELGASAGLNLLLDRYGYDLGGIRAGDPASPLQLKPSWEGSPPPAADVRIAARAGVDLSPADLAKLPAYVWPDQPARLRRLETALAIAAADPPPLDRGDAAEWIEARLDEAPEPGVTRVVLHSIAFQYFPAKAQQRVAARIERAGAEATDRAPLAWLRFEMAPGDKMPSVRLRTWPGEERKLGFAHPHGAWIRWLA